MTTEYRVRLDREACDGVFACLVRDDRFVEAADGLAGIEGGSSDLAATSDGGTETVAAFDDDRLDDARQAASACPVDAIDVTVVGDE
ncbi:ferredoxin [Halosimplex aquaticum]|uniref:Ferredoxin n=1 Tax=Halosimplex aquaticum TaxID=3026162 RepID=A0ABD5Y834_9EURY